MSGKKSLGKSKNDMNHHSTQAVDQSSGSQVNKKQKSSLTLEEKLLKQEIKRREREEKQLLKKQLKKPPEKKSEEEIVKQYANIIIAKQQTRGMVNIKNHSNLQARTPSKDLWQDTDFYFSVVFQSLAQKIQFLNFIENKFNFELDDNPGQTIQIINGLKLAEKMGLTLQKEIAEPYQSGSIELKNIVLDDEKG